MKFKIYNCLRDIKIEKVVIAAWTGRKQKKVRQHIKELSQLGISSPKQTPTFYEINPALITQRKELEVYHEFTSGEAEFCLINFPDGIYVGVGSDHTDREKEKIDIFASKEACLKPIASELWSLALIINHWDQLILRSHIVNQGEKSLYQEDKLSSLLSPDELINKYLKQHKTFFSGTIMFGGTIEVKGKIRNADRFIFELYDPVLQNIIRGDYSIRILNR